MKFKKVVLVLAILLFLTGCGEEEPTQTSTGGDSKAFIGGNLGLHLSFLAGAPPQKVFDKEDPFDISLRLENVGEWDIENPSDIKIEIKGINPADFSTSGVALRTTSQEIMLGAELGAQGTTIDGSVTNIDFNNLKYSSPVTGSITLPIRADVCYEYGTKATTKLCILEDLTGARRKASDTLVCNPEEQKTIENSGAPVQIENFKQVIRGTDKISLEFTIVDKRSGGSVYNTGTSCETSRENEDKVFAKVTTGIAGLECTSLDGGIDSTQGYVRLAEGERKITCTQTLPQDRTDFEKSIDLELKYAYQETLDQEIIIEHLE